MFLIRTKSSVHHIRVKVGIRICTANPMNQYLTQCSMFENSHTSIYECSSEGKGARILESNVPVRDPDSDVRGCKHPSSLLNSSATEQVIMLSDALAIFVCGWLPPALYPALGRMCWDVNSIRTSRSVAKVFSSREHPESTTQATKPPPPLASRPLFPSDLKEPS